MLVPDDVGAITNEGLGLVLGGRTYGNDQDLDHLGSLRRMEIPPGMDVLRARIESESQLLSLPAGSSGKTVYDAFGHDLETLIRYRDAFKQTVTAAVRARASFDDANAQLFLDRITQEISEIVFEPTIDLGPQAIKLPDEKLLSRLQQQFRADAIALTRNLAIWLHVLAESQFVSVIEWFNPVALRYHFFRMETTRQQLDKKKTITGNMTVGRTITTTEREQVDLHSERRVHTVVNARTHSLEEYRRRVPARIATLIDSIPPDVRPFLTIIDGTVSKEEVHRRVTESHVEETSKTVFIPDPALALFNTWAINGWGGSTTEASRSVYKDHALSKANKYLVGEAIATTVITGLGGIAEGPRGAIALGAIMLILSLFHQIGIRIAPK